MKTAQENRSWGYTRIQGALANLTHEVGRGTIAKILQEAGIDLAPGRREGMTWKEFLRTHWDVIAATGFFTAEVWTPVELVRYHVVREAVSQFVEHYHQERNHQGLENKIIRPELAEFPAEGSVHRRKRLGEPLNCCYRKAV